MRTTAAVMGLTILALGLGLPFVFAQVGSDEDALERARKLKDEIAKNLSIRLATQESAHFLIHSDTPSRERAQVLKAAESVYKKLDGIFHMPKGTKLWQGKYVILLFKDRQEFENYCYKVRDMQGELAGAIGTTFAPGVIGCIVNSEPGQFSDHTRSFYFFLSTTFLDEFRPGKKLPPWVHMGFSTYCRNTLGRDRDGANFQRRVVKHAIKQGDWRDLNTIRNTKDWPPSDREGRGLCFSLTDYMISLGQKKFVQFVERLKEGATESEAIQDAFGMRAPEFEIGWLAFIERKY